MAPFLLLIPFVLKFCEKDHCNMAENASVLEDNSTLSKLDRNLLKIEKAFALISGLAIFSLMLLAVRSVGGREFFEWPLSGYVDWIMQLMPLIAILAVSFAMRDGTHIRMDIFVSKLSGRVLWTFELITTSIVLILMLLLMWGSWSHFDRAFDWNAPLFSRDSTIDIGLPIWPSKILVPIGFAILCLRLSLQSYGYIRALIFGLSKPVAVPLVRDPAKLAAAEAENLINRG